MVEKEEEIKEEWTRTKLGWEETYKQFTRDTAQYPKDVEMEYLMIGLANEVGEVLGKFKKHLRGDMMVVQDFNDALVAEMGDVLWYYARILDVLDVSFYDVMVNNIDKLNSRMMRDKIKGDGDDR
jgi:NTP pyrophosphatase (non-canonical NTP hydrolase)